MPWGRPRLVCTLFDSTMPKRAFMQLPLQIAAIKAIENGAHTLCSHRRESCSMIHMAESPSSRPAAPPQFLCAILETALPFFSSRNRPASACVFGTNAVCTLSYRSGGSDWEPKAAQDFSHPTQTSNRSEKFMSRHFSLSLSSSLEWHSNDHGRFAVARIQAFTIHCAGKFKHVQLALVGLLGLCTYPGTVNCPDSAQQEYRYCGKREVDSIIFTSDLWHDANKSKPRFLSSAPSNTS